MELSEIRELKAELEDEILDLLVNFEKDTGVLPKAITIQRSDWYSETGHNHTIEFIDIVCEV